MSEQLATKPHLSKSQIEMYGKCPEQYRRRYIEGEKVPPGIAIMKGQAVHGGARENFKQKMATRIDLPVIEVVGLAVAEFERQVASGYVLSDEERAIGNKTVIGAAKDETVLMADFHAREQAPEYQPIMVEEKVRIPLPGPRDILGVIDLAAEGDKIADFKTTSKSKPQSEADQSVQLTIYDSGFRRVTGRQPNELVLDTIVRTKKQLYRQRLSTRRFDEDFVALANRINSISGAIEAGIFPPAPIGVWWCSGKFCGYWRTCKYVNSERKEAANESD